MSCPSVLTYEFCQCLYEKGCIQRKKAPIQDKKAFQALNNYKNILKNKKIFRPTDPILFWHESLNRHILFFGLSTRITHIMS